MNILLVHGALGCAAQLDSLKQALINQGHAVYDLNFSGHAGRKFESDFGIEQFASDTEQFIMEHKLHNLTVFGYSMGGYVALWLAYKKPNLFNTIITLGTKFDWSPESAEKEIRRMNPKKIQEKIPAFARLLQARHAPNDWKELMNRTAHMMQQLGKVPLLTTEIIHSIKAKTVVALGDADDMADRTYSQTIAAILPNGKFELLDATPHPIERVDVDKLVNLILSSADLP